MNPYVLSIGLNVGATEPAAQLGATLRATEALFGPPLSVAMGRSEWQGVPERFVQIAVLATPERVSRDVSNLAAALHQAAIAVTAANVRPDCRWILYKPTGVDSIGGTLAEFPIITETPEE